MKNFNLHTIVRLPFGVFEPYTPIRSNILFFDASGRTEITWFYEIVMPDSRKKYTKTKPLRFEEFEDCIKWWSRREANENAWPVTIGDIITNGFNLDFPNPSRPDVQLPDDPAELMRIISTNQTQISNSLDALSAILKDNVANEKIWGYCPRRKSRNFCHR